MQILTGEPQKIKHSRPVLGMLQTSKSLVQQNKITRDQVFDAENIGNKKHDDMDDALNNNLITNSNHVNDKNPMINKRILLKVNYEQLQNLESEFVPADLETEINNNNIQHRDNIKQAIHDFGPKLYKPEPTIASEKDIDDPKYQKLPNENVIYDKMKPIKPIAPNDEDSTQNHGRIVVYGDSNCLDSTHIEKPCFWMLDALLEFTMSSHISNVLKDLNRSPNIQFTTSSSSTFPKRLPNNHLHLYSKVLIPNEAASSSSSPLKRPIPKCIKLRWDPPIFLNISASNDFYGQAKDDKNSDNMENEQNLRRKLESQKGEVGVEFK